jgi:1,4-alpha-glucan branching enzyme
MSLKKKYLASKPECKVTFKLDKDVAGDYKEVTLVGDFNNWDQSKHQMKKLKSGDFSITINLENGNDYQFKYLANKTEWLNDDEADQLVVNEFQGHNSVVTV